MPILRHIVLQQGSCSDMLSTLNFHTWPHQIQTLQRVFSHHSLLCLKLPFLVIPLSKSYLSGRLEVIDVWLTFKLLAEENHGRLVVVIIIRDDVCLAEVLDLGL